jgi:uncharacterized membrane protein
MTAESPELKNIRDILELERQHLGDPSPLDRFTEGVSNFAGGGLFVLIHVLFFTAWISFNDGRSATFDPYPFNLLTLALSLEAIVLTSFVLRVQRRMAMQANKRAELDLQINLLAEQELTAILRVLCAVGEKLGVDVERCDRHVGQFRSQTDVHAIAAKLDTERAAAG